MYKRYSTVHPEIEKRASSDKIIAHETQRGEASQAEKKERSFAADRPFETSASFVFKFRMTEASAIVS